MPPELGCPHLQVDMAVFYWRIVSYQKNILDAIKPYLEALIRLVGVQSQTRE